MALVVIVGTAERVEGENIWITDSTTKEEIHCRTRASDLLSIKIGDQGFFTGDLIKGNIYIKRLDINRIINPLYEDDLFEQAGLFTLIAVVDDPFPKFYKEFIAKQNDESKTESAEVSS